MERMQLDQGYHLDKIIPLLEAKPVHSAWWLAQIWGSGQGAGYGWAWITFLVAHMLSQYESPLPPELLGEWNLCRAGIFVCSFTALLPEVSILVEWMNKCTKTLRCLSYKLLPESCVYVIDFKEKLSAGPYVKLDRTLTFPLIFKTALLCVVTFWTHLLSC